MIYVAAGGNGTRIRAGMNERGFRGIPKHLLPTGEPGGETLLSRNVARAKLSDAGVAVVVNDANRTQVDTELSRMGLSDADVKRLVQQSQLGPFSFTSFIDSEQTSFSIAGDIYIDHLNWRYFKASHELNAAVRPVSFLVGRASVGPQAAVFEVAEDGAITDFYRSGEQQDDVFRNIGVYAFTMSPPVTEIMEQYTANNEPDQQDKIALDLISAGLVRAHEHPGKFFNINTIQDYDDLRAHTARM